MNYKYTLYMHISPSNKVYIGITNQVPEVRWGNNGCNYTTQYFNRAIKKYGWNNFKHIIVETNLSQKQAQEKEIYLIKKYNATNPNYGYNIQPGGYLGNKGVEVSDETRLKISKANKGRKLTQEQKHNISLSLQGREITKSHREHLSKALKGKYVKELHPFYGKKRSKQTCENISNGLKGHKVSENVMNKSVPAMHTHEAIKKKNEALKNRNCFGANNSFYGKHHSEETKAKIGARTRGKIWVHNITLRKNKQIAEDELIKYIDNGWVKGFIKWKLME